MNPQLYTQPLSDYTLDELSTKDGILEQTPVLSLDVEDEWIIRNLHKAIDDSQKYYDDVNEFNLKNKRTKNEQMLQGKHLQEHKLYRHQTPYIDNELWVGVDAISSYVTARTPRAEVYPARDSEESKLAAQNLEKYLLGHSEKFVLPEKNTSAVYNSLSKYVGFLKLRWDPNYGQYGDVIPEVVDPRHVIVDHTAKLGENPRFICHVLKDTVENLISKFPDKEEAILRTLAIKRKGSRNTSAFVAYREVWFTYYDNKKKPQEAVAWYIQDLVLDKCKNPNWLYGNEGKNFLDNPMKPFIPINVDNDGSNWIDKTSAVEQAVPQQDILNKLGRQILDNLATANGFKVWDAAAISKDDLQNMTGDPNQSIVVKTKPNQSIRDVVEQLQPQMVSAQLIEEKNATRQVIHNILGTPDQFRGDDQDQAKTASQALMIKNQASGRQDKIVRAVDRALDKYFKFLTQMIQVWYTDTHMVTINGGDGNFDFVEMHKSKVEPGMNVCVQSGTTLPFDKARQEAVAQNAAELGLLAPYDYYKMMHMENPQKLYDNFVKYKTDPQQLALDVDNNQSDDKAIMDFTALMGGKDVEQRDDPTTEYIEQFRKSMISDEFLNAKKSIQNKVIKFVDKAIQSLAVRQQLDQMSMQPGQTPLNPPPASTQPPGPAPVAGGPAPVEPPIGGPVPGAPMPAPMPGSPIQGIMQGQAPVPTAPNLNPGVQPTVQPQIGNLPPF